MGAEIEDLFWVFEFKVTGRDDGVLYKNMGCGKQICLEGKEEVSLESNEFAVLVGHVNGGENRQLNA